MTTRSGNHTARLGDSRDAARCDPGSRTQHGRRKTALTRALAAAVIALSAVVAASTSNVAAVRADSPRPSDPSVSAVCDDAYCTPGIKGNVVLGAPCNDTAHYVFGTTSWGRLVFCGSPRRYAPRYFRAMPMLGIKQLGTNCTGYENDMAQAPDGLFLTCAIEHSQPVWLSGDA